MFAAACCGTRGSSAPYRFVTRPRLPLLKGGRSAAQCSDQRQIASQSCARPQYDQARLKPQGFAFSVQD